MPRTKFIVVCILIFSCTNSWGKDLPFQEVLWPESGTPILRITFDKFKEVGNFRKSHNYVCETMAVNLSEKVIPSLELTLYLYDKNKVRIGQGLISLSNIAPKEAVKFQTMIEASGSPVSVSLAGRSPRMISVTVNSVPQGAILKMDGIELGTTPKLVQVGVGKHILEFSKEGFNSGKFPLEIGTDDASGGTVSYELGTAAHDTIELRDGSVLAGDLESVSATQVTLRVGGAMQSLDRNRVKRILLVERDSPLQ